MGSYENILKIEEIRRRMEEGNAPSAQKILDTMDLKKVKNIADLNLIAEVYTENERYEEASELLLRIYNKTKTRKTLYQLIWVSIHGNKVEDAQKYLKQYEKIAPKDFYNDIFRYKIDKLMGEPYEKLIDTLENLKKTEYMEEWAYELAKLYYKAGMEEQCIRECSDIILWFGEGIYVEKAKILRAYYSGEADKDKIIEELKRRALNGKSKEGQEDQEYNSREALEGKENVYIRAAEGEYEDVSNKTLYSTEFTSTELDSAEFDTIELGSEEIDTIELGSAELESTELDPTELEDYLSKDVQDILAKGWSEEVRSNEEYNDIHNKDFSKKERERAELEVENTLYQLLEQEDLDEEDRKLSRIADEWNFNPEELFGDFLLVNSVKKQLVHSLEYILKEQTTSIQIIITGAAGAGKTTLAKELAVFLNIAGKLKTSKIAKIQSTKLNQIDIMEKKEALRDCCLVIENAGELQRATIDKLLELLEYSHGDLAVILEEEKQNLNKLFCEYPKLMDLFVNRIHLPE
jgi:hypothetical protein